MAVVDFSVIADQRNDVGGPRLVQPQTGPDIALQPEQAFYLVGNIDDVKAKAQKLKSEAA